MGWSILFVNTKTLLILGVLCIFLFLGFLLLLLEIKLKKKQKVKFTQDIESIRVLELKKDLKKAKTKQEKLEAINKQAKGLFRERFHLGPKRSYSDLAEIFNNKKLYQYSSFCERMFEAYYSNDGVTEKNLKELLIILTRLIRETKTYLDPEEYSLDNLYTEKPAKEKEKKREVPKSFFNLERKEELVKKQKESLTEKQVLLKEKQKTINQKEKELAKKELQNKRLLAQIEKKLKEQEDKIKEQERIQEKIQEQLKLEENKKATLSEHRKKEHKIKTEIGKRQVRKSWREKIETKPIVGKDWLKEHKSRRRKNR